MAGGDEHWLSDLLGTRVVDAGARAAGRVADLTLEPGRDADRVAALSVKRGRRPPLRIPWGDVAALEPHEVRLREGAPLVAAPDPPAAIHLRRDVLDAQVVDIAGRRRRRVSVVRLRRTGPDLEIVGVDTGWRMLMRRFGRRRGARASHDLLPWPDVHLAPADGRAVPPADALAGLTPTGLSQLVASLPPDDGAAVLEAVAPEHAADALSRARPRLGGRMMSALHAAPAGEILTAMPIDDAVAALRHIDSDRSAALLDRIPSQRAAELRRLLALPPQTAGGLMTTEVLTAREDEPLDAIRAQVAAEPPLLEGLTTVFLYDEAGRYVSALTPSALLAGAPPKPLPALAVDTPLDEVIGFFALEDVLALPVLDAQGRIAGAVAIDDVLEELLVERLPHHRRRYRHLRWRDRVQA